MNSNSFNNEKPLNRRAFLSLSGSVILSGLLPISSYSGVFSYKLNKMSMSKPGMGTFINMTVLHSSSREANDAIYSAYTEIHRLSSILSRHDSTSVLSELNSKGKLNSVPIELFDVLKASLYYNKITHGYFDITILPTLNLYEQNFKTTQNPPSLQDVQKSMAQVGSEYIQLSSNSVSFDKANMKITLDAIAKGYIIDKAMEILKSHGIKHALINAGGDIAVHGGANENKPWKIAIQDPKNKNKTIEVITMTNGAVATSGNYEIYFDKEKVYHHLISPLSNEPVKNISSVSIQARTVMQADALATATFVMGAKKGSQFIVKTQGIEGLIIDGFGKKMLSKAWNKS